ncbi:MAG: hypothetical protein ABL895_20860 [Cyclobacteriaceae bacterium]
MKQVRNRGYLFFQLYFILASFLISCNTSQEITYWDVIDQNSVLVFETVRPPTVTEKSILPFLKVSSTSFAVALQSISKSDYDLVYAYALQEKEYAVLLNSSTLKQSGHKIANRLYSGFEIKELRDNTNKVILAFAYIKGFFIISESAILIENSIRVFENKEGINFRTKNKSLFQFASIKSDAGNLFVNISQLSLSMLANSKLKESVPILQNLAESSVLDVKVDSELISMNGFTLDSASSGLGLSAFQDQKAIKFGMARLIPNYSRSVVYYGVSDLKRFSRSVNDSGLVKLNFQDELAVCSINPEQNKFIIIIKLANQDITDFDSENYYESYSGYEIRSLKRGVLSKSFAQLVPKDTFDFFTIKDDYAFLSKDIDELKSLIDAIESDDTWGKSLAFQQFYERGLQESNVSLFFRDPVIPIDGVNEKWKPLIDSLRLSPISWASIQFSALDNHFYTSVNLATSAKGEKSSGKFKTSGSFRLQNSIAAGFAVKNHSTGGSELILQDSTFRISLFSSDNGTLWQYQLDAMILAAHQIDYFKNGKLQYLITTPNSLYLIDRLGRDVKGFPKKLPFDARSSEVVDYDKSKNYRYLLSSGTREIYILNKDATMLDRWSPNSLPFDIEYSPVYYKIGNKDYFLVISNDKMIHLINRKGDFEKRFQLKLSPFAGDYFIEARSAIGNSFIYTVSQDGVITKQSFDGKSKSQENLIKGNSSKFYLKRVVGKSDFFFFRIDTDKIAVFDELNQLVFERQNPGSITLTPSVVSLTQGKSIFSFYDTEQKLSYLYDQIGNPVINRPLESTIAPVFGNNIKSKKLFIYSFSDEIVTTTQLN